MLSELAIICAVLVTSCMHVLAAFPMMFQTHDYTCVTIAIILIQVLVHDLDPDRTQSQKYVHNILRPQLLHSSCVLLFELLRYYELYRSICLLICLFPTCVYTNSVCAQPYQVCLAHPSSDGMSRSGVFITCMSEIERVKVEGAVDIFQTVKTARAQRPHMVYTSVSNTLKHYMDTMIFQNFVKKKIL